MTRFARAKGSKASNERTPEDSTPWEVMKEQLLQAKKDNEESKKRKEAEEKRIENYENFLKEQKVLKRKATWCDFPESEQTHTNASINNGPVEKTGKKNKKKKKNNEQLKTEMNVSNEVENTIKSKKKKHKIETGTDPKTNTENTELEESSQSNKKKKNKKVKKSQLSEGLPKHQFENTQDAVEANPESKASEKINNQKQQKKKKNGPGKPMRRKEINDHSFQLIINGKDIELVRYDGFPVMKKDAERIEELKSNMLKKGIPKSEVQRTIKLERRRAEKALARVKRDVCYNCRKGGHVLSDCPELKSKIPGADGADGVCFKCGSTEHRQFECKVQKDNEFRFATCFICKEPGHIARQCPDNPKGLYPNGGNCRLCGDVTHLRKDCPTVDSSSNIKLQTLESGENIEDFDQQSNNVKPQETSKKPKKIKF
ncbi:unnamed protein product [Arctia plantaginis]|uniref:CCHC-type domain-containing protein n=1 Tax=Arctia plantaginis TaxID=874455 RepID=A0A8S0ZDK1_ARCPL|nr:unnamed protein product [Arctia plantaginis]